MRNKIVPLLALIGLFFSCCKPIPNQRMVVEERLVITPDYTDVLLPPNIAPISFEIKNRGDYYYLEFLVNEQIVATYSSSKPTISISKSIWNKLNRHDSFSCVVSILKDGEWREYNKIVNRFSTEWIDPYLSYRLIAPGYELWSEMGIYQRDLTSFDEMEILTNNQTNKGCMNCHTYANHSTENMMLHLRGKSSGTLIKRGEEIDKIQFNANEELLSGTTYSSWHPSAKYIAYSTNEINQYFHVTGTKPVEVADVASDIVLYNVLTQKIITSPILHNTDRLETFPEWSADGKTLYYTVASKGVKACSIDSIYYSLYAIDFDVEMEHFFNERLLIDAVQLEKSISFPKPSPDGKFVVATLSDYGNFSIWHPEADLIIYSIETNSWRKADEINSEDTESYHSFSSCGNWMVFSSRRDDGLYTVPYFTRLDSQSGLFSKPFKLPQKSCDYYTNLFQSFNLPTFTKDKFVSHRSLFKKAIE
ncbi:MAG: TolB family protein [Phocaeicola sp.]